MTIRRQINLIVLAFTVLGLTMLSVEGYLYRQEDKTRGISESLDILARNIAELGMLSHEVIQNPSRRVTEQWSSRYRTSEALISNILGISEYAVAESIAENYLRLEPAYVRLLESLRDDSNPARTQLLADDLRTLTQSIVTATFKLQNLNREKLKQFRDILFYLEVLIVILVVVLLFGFGYLLKQNILRRALLLESAMREISAGDLTRRLNDDRQDELGELARTFDSMSQELFDKTGLLNAIFENANAVIFAKAVSGEYLMVNKLYEQIFNIKREDFIGKTDYDVFPREVAELYRSNDLKVIEQNKVITEQENATHADGNVHHYISVKFPLYDENNRIKGVCGIATEITDRVIAEQQLIANAAALKRSNQELEKFAYIASHDLQEPLRKIQAFGERLRQRIEPHLDEKSQDYFDRMTNAATRMRVLIDDLLIFSRITTHGKPFIKVPLSEIVAGVLSDLELRLEETGAKVSISQLPAIDADQLQMRQLFQNLLSNALKFTDPQRTPVIEVTHRVIKNGTDLYGLNAAMLEITVVDNGIGFDPVYTEKIFEVFQRLHSRQEYPGSGVGLALVRRIVERHGGRVWAESKPGEGARFVLQLRMQQV